MNTPFNINISDKELNNLGIDEFAYTTIDSIDFDERFRTLCQNNACGHYGKTWACPPAIGTFEECKTRVLKYSNVFVFCSRYPLEDSFDVEGMENGRIAFSKVCQKLISLVKEKTLILGNESCTNCNKCTYPVSPCRFPNTLLHSVEGYSINVSSLCSKVNIKYIINSNTVSYFGIILF